MQGSSGVLMTEASEGLGSCAAAQPACAGRWHPCPRERSVHPTLPIGASGESVSAARRTGKG